MLKRHIATVVLLLLVLSSTAQERPISELRTGIPSGTVEGSAVVAAHDDTFFVAWRSYVRGGLGARLDAAGQRIGAPVALPVSPRVVFRNGEEWFVVGNEGWVRVSEEGVLRDVEPRRFEATWSRIIDAAWGGQSLFVLAAIDAPLTTTLTLFTFDAQMKLKRSSVVDNRAASQGRVISDGATALVFHSVGDESTTMASLFDADGALLRQQPWLAAPWRVRSLGSRGDGSGYFVVEWQQPVFSFSGAYLGAFVDHELRRRPTASLGSTSVSSLFAPHAAWDGSAFTLFVSDTLAGTIWTTRVAGDGTIAGTANIAFRPGNFAFVNGAALPGVTLLLQSGLIGSPFTTYLQARTGATPAALAAAEPVSVDAGASDQHTPSTASNAALSLVAWRERLTLFDPYSLFVTRVARDGTVLDPQSIALSDSTCFDTRPAVAAAGDGFLVAWSEPEGVKVARIGADGTVGRKFVVDRDDRCRTALPRIIPSATSALVVWTELSRVYAARVAHDGTPIDTVPLSLGTARTGVHGASNGTDYLVAWDGSFVRITGGGTPLGFHGDQFLGGSARVLAAWWNGRTYSVLNGDWNNLKITRVDASGRPSAVAGSVALPGVPSLAPGDPACDAAGCSVVAGTKEGATAVLREIRAQDDGVTATVVLRERAVVAPALYASNDTLIQVAALRAAGGRLYAVYPRRELSPAAAGALRIVLRPMDGWKTRAVRH